MAERKGPARKAGAKTTTKAKGKAKPKRKAPTAAQRKAKAEAKRLAEEMELAKDGLTGAQTGAAKTIESAELYRAIYTDWASGFDMPALAAAHGLKVRRCQQIVAELRASELDVLRLRDPLLGLRLAHDLVIRHTTAISEYAQLAKDAKQDSVKLGAMRDRDAAVRRFTDLMQELNVLPKNLGTLRVQEDFLALMDALLDGMDKLGIPVDQQRTLVELVELRLVRRDGRSQLSIGGADDDVIDVSGEEMAGAKAAA